MTKTILEAQEEWKKAGFAPRKTNTALFNRFRALCDDFFGRKSEFFKKTKNEFAENLAKKTSLCEKAEGALAESTDWKKDHRCHCRTSERMENDRTGGT